MVFAQGDKGNFVPLIEFKKKITIIIHILRNAFFKHDPKSDFGSPPVLFHILYGRYWKNRRVN